MERTAFRTERDIERWMQPYTGAVLMPGLRHKLHTSSRLFFDFYWQLLELGYSEQQIATRAIEWRWAAAEPLHEDFAMLSCVFELAQHQNLQPSPELPLYTDSTHPRRIVDRFK